MTNPITQNNPSTRRLQFTAELGVGGRFRPNLLSPSVSGQLRIRDTQGLLAATVGAQTDLNSQVHFSLGVSAYRSIGRFLRFYAGPVVSYGHLWGNYTPSDSNLSPQTSYQWDYFSLTRGPITPRSTWTIGGQIAATFQIRPGTVLGVEAFFGHQETTAHSLVVLPDHRPSPDRFPPPPGSTPPTPGPQEIPTGVVDSSLVGGAHVFVGVEF